MPKKNSISMGREGIREPFSYNIIGKAVEGIFPKDVSEGSSVIREFVYVLALGLFGRSVGSTGFAYDGTTNGNALFDAAKMIRILMYFFSNTIVTIFFKNIETMYLNEHHDIDEEFLGLGVTLRQIHGSFTNGLISFIYTLALNNDLVGGGIEFPLDIDLKEIVETFFVKMSFNDFEDILINNNDPYKLREANTETNWNKSFSKLLMSSKQKGRDKSKKDGNPKFEFQKVKSKISELSPNLKEREINEIIELLEGQKPKKQFHTGITLTGGSDASSNAQNDAAAEHSEYFFPGKEGEGEAEDNHKYFYYKLFLLESMLNSERFLDSFEIMFNLICRLTNRLIKRVIPLIRKMSSKTLNNIGAFIFSLGGPFTEILWFGFSTLLSLLNIGETALDIGDDLHGSLPIRGEFTQSSILQGSEPETLNSLLGVFEKLQNPRHVGGGTNYLNKFDKIVKECFLSLF